MGESGGDAVLSARERWEIAGRARTLHERLAGPPNESGSEPPFDPDDLLAEWADRFPDEEAFAARLDREGLDEASVRAQCAATAWPADEPLPDWIGDLDALIRHVERYRSLDRPPVAAPDGTPFVELVSAVADFGRVRLADDCLLPAGVTGLETWLVATLSELALRAVYVEFESFLEYHDPTLLDVDPAEVDEPTTTYYDRFVDAMFDGGFGRLCVEYPVLARQLVGVLEHWVAGVERVWRRLRADRDALRDRFGVAGEVTSLAVLASDSHAGGQVPVQVEFESGSVIYKPRPVDAGVALYAVLDRLGEHLATPPFRSPTYLAREEYGWMEPIPYRDAPDDDAVDRYYERAGVLLCVGYVLDLPDCQFENVVAHGDQPTVVDGETLLHPYLEPAASTYETEIASVSANSVLRTALLPWTVGDPTDGDADLPKSALTAGLGGSSERTEVSQVSKPTVVAVNTDAMSVRGRPPTVDRTENTPTVGGTDQPPDAHLAAIETGFRRAYEAIVDLHADGRFLDEILDPGLVAGVENRLVFRSTDVYRSTLRECAGRDPLRDGARLTVEFERLAAPFFDGRVLSDRFWPLYAAERRALCRRDVPRFASGQDRTAISHDGEPIDVAADASGYERCRRRLDSLDDADCREQVWLLRRSLDDSPPASATPPTRPPATDERLLAEAIRYGDAAIDAAIETAAGRGWVSVAGVNLPQLCVSPADHSLYDGRAGIGLAAAALYDRTGHDRFREQAVAAFEPVVEGRGEIPTGVGGLKGTGSVVYGLSVAAELLDRPAYRDRAGAVARDVDFDGLADDEPFDVVDGMAGLLLALLAHYERFGGSAVRDLAVDCGDRLLAGRESVDGHRVPPAGDGHRVLPTGDGHRVRPAGNAEPAPGLAHGASGIAYALARLAAIVGDDRYAAAARETLAFLSTRYDPERSNYATATEPGRERYLDQWCRGRAGCGLAGLAIGRRLDDETLVAEADELLSATAGAAFHRFDHLCCGNLGRSMALLEAARLTDREPTAARALAARCLARREAAGALSMPGHGEPVHNPTFFEGVSGVAYALLRLREPDALPCVLLLE